MEENNFYSLVAEGNKSEQLVADWITNKGWTVVNVTADKQYQDLEIDLIATKGNEVRTIEVKRENRCADTGNLLLETVTNTRTKNKGWFKKTQADFICWHDTQNNKLLFSLTSALQEIIKQPYVRYKEWKSFEKNKYISSCGWFVRTRELTAANL